MKTVEKKIPKQVEPESVLSLSLRPTALSSLIGQESTIKAIRNHIAKRPPRTWIFTGSPGTGKTTLARIMSIAFQCEHMTEWGDPCSACLNGKFAIHEINASKDSGVAALEEIAQLSYMRPIVGKKRVIIVDECHFLSKTAWSSLLKPTEDVPDFTVWIFLTSEPSKIPAANQRRAAKYQLKVLGIDATEEFIKTQASKAGITRELDKFIEAVHTMGIGAPGVLLQALEKYGAGANAIEATAGNDGTSVDTFKLCKACTAGDWNTVRSVLKGITGDDVRWVRASVAGWLKGCLMRENDPRGQERAATSMLELSNPPYDESIYLVWLHGVLWKIANRYRRDK